jgi:hypothetical protein
MTIIKIIGELLDPLKPLSAGLDPDFRSGPADLYPVRPGCCPRCGADDPRSALEWPDPRVRCKHCVAQLKMRMQ